MSVTGSESYQDNLRLCAEMSIRKHFRTSSLEPFYSRRLRERSPLVGHLGHPSAAHSAALATDITRARA